MAKPAASLRGQLLTWLLPLYVGAMVLSSLAGYLIAHDASAESLDQGLADAAGLYAQHLRENPAAMADGELPTQAQRVLLVMPEDRVFFSLRDAAGNLLAGEATLSDNELWGTLQAPVHFDAQYRGYWVRGISVVFEAGGRALHMVIATTALKRDALMGKILLGMVAPQMLLFLVTIVLVRAGIFQGLAPLERLRTDLARKSHRDLSSLDAEGAPAELRPIIEDVNSLMARLERALASQRHFIADAAHQLRTPIAGLLAQVEAAEPGKVPAPLLATARRLSRLVTQLLALSRAEPGSEPERTGFDLAGKIRSAANDWLPSAFRRNIDVRFDLAEAWLVGSPPAFRELLSNLLDNAIRYGHDGGHIVVRCFAASGEVVLQVDDDGPGIPPGERRNVFERFYRLPGTQADGCGLGLAIVDSLVRRHGGTVVLLDAAKLGGLRVEVRIPAASPAAGSLKTPT